MIIPFNPMTCPIMTAYGGLRTGYPQFSFIFHRIFHKIALVDPLMEPLWLGVVEPPLRTCWSARHSRHRNAGHSWNRPRGVHARPPHSLWYHKDNFQDYIKLKDYFQYQYQDNMNINLIYPCYQFILYTQRGYHGYIKWWYFIYWYHQEEFLHFAKWTITIFKR